RFGRIVEVIFDVFELGNLGAFSDVKRASMKRQTVWPVQTCGDNFRLAFSAPVDDSIDFVENAVANEHGPLVAEPQGTGIGDAAGVDLDLKAFGQPELWGR